MKKIVPVLFTVSLLLFAGCKSSEKKPEKLTSTSIPLEQRLDEYMKLNDEMKLEQLMDYIYPKLFTIAPKAEILNAMKEGFSNEELSVELDSVKVEKIHPIFEIGDGSFAKVDYSMVMVMNVTFDGDRTNQADHVQKVKTIAETMKEKYGSKNVKVDEKGIIRIWEKNKMVAVKDEYAKEWSVVSLKEEDPTMSKIFSKEVLDKLATYN
jgi:hypothetical protein